MPVFKCTLKRCVVEVAKRKRICKHDTGHEIAKGQKCLVVYEDAHQYKTYCLECARQMLATTIARIRSISEELTA